ncbi:hypothetical protein [Mycolicibacterium neworleansense]|uniref:Uncharacterized protein n=1 Tax=Mycolicibacterium neworleansense TaxID=146018 RepID=A0A0H5RSK1_9MYCO|nr:hypothetical protein [Mycolicibacterium neworleansense]MCV7361550.1 hypothetical protein [Mycolicibacterium neworleansense]CRZ16903.1 hypothetical protein BN2156_03781 [Mycolicibacterium neworleansense]
MTERVESVEVEHVRAGDTLSMSGDDDPRAHVFRVAKVELRNKLTTGEQPRVVLTSEPAGDDGEPMVLDYPTGTRLRKIVGRPSG